LHLYSVFACSPQLKAAGVQTGMRFSEARKLVPQMKVIICRPSDTK
jgi:nucleotidyltransferase/DNA polymerase involved in DNA repair